MHRATLGIILASSFILLEAIQTVYFGGLFQQMSIFLFGALVFGITMLICVGWTALTNKDAIRIALANPRPLLSINLCAVMTFGCFLMSIQLIEPAITYTISGGVMPIVAYLLSRFGVPEGDGIRNRIEAFGIALLLISVIFLALITIRGDAGFVRGDRTIALVGVLCAVADGTFFTLIVVYSKRLDLAGVGSFAVLGLRLPLYVIAAGTLAAFGLDHKQSHSLAEIAFFVSLGVLVTLPPLYFLQKAVSMISTLTISILTALGPFVIFALQMLEARVQFAPQTLAGITLYALASIIATIGTLRATAAARA